MQGSRPLTEAEKQQWNEIQNARKAEAKRLAQIAKRGGETSEEEDRSDDDREEEDRAPH